MNIKSYCFNRLDLQIIIISKFPRRLRCDLGIIKCRVPRTPRTPHALGLLSQLCGCICSQTWAFWGAALQRHLWSSVSSTGGPQVSLRAAALCLGRKPDGATGGAPGWPCGIADQAGILSPQRRRAGQQPPASAGAGLPTAGPLSLGGRSRVSWTQPQAWRAEWSPVDAGGAEGHRLVPWDHCGLGTLCKLGRTADPPGLRPLIPRLHLATFLVSSGQTLHRPGQTRPSRAQGWGTLHGPPACPLADESILGLGVSAGPGGKRASPSGGPGSWGHQRSLRL